METLGNVLLLDGEKIGYFASGTIASLSVLPTLDWAVEVARREDVAIVSGFHSKMEREVLDFLLRGKCGIVCVLARPIYKKIPEKFREAYDEGRVLFISQNSYKSTMSSKVLCHAVNEYVAEVSDQLVFSSVNEGSSLYRLIFTKKEVITI